jgi:hypothetical protein
MQIGDAVVYVDEFSVEQNALLTAVHGDGTEDKKWSVNLCYVSNDAARTDTYGRQIMRDASVPHESNQSARGRYWRER